MAINHLDYKNSDILEPSSVLFLKPIDINKNQLIMYDNYNTGAVAQLIARSASVPKVLGSNPAFSTTHMTCLFSVSWQFE